MALAPPTPFETGEGGNYQTTLLSEYLNDATEERINLRSSAVSIEGHAPSCPEMEGRIIDRQEVRSVLVFVVLRPLLVVLDIVCECGLFQSFIVYENETGVAISSANASE